MDQFTTLLTNSGHRITTPRRAVFRVLAHAENPLAIAEINQQSGSIDRVSVYRTLELFAQLGIVDIIYVGWKKRYELADPFRAHHHHIVCTKCGRITAIENSQLERLIHDIADTHRHSLTGHHIELRGTCSSCGSRESNHSSL